MSGAAVALPYGLILAGGLSRRMGRTKALLPLAGRPIVEHIFLRLAPQVSSTSLNAPDEFPNPLGLPLVPDTIDGRIGPLAGVLAGLRAIGSETSGRLLTVPSDSPFLPLDLAERLMAESGEETIAVATSASGRHPVFALWPVAIADDLESWVGNADNRRINAFLDRHATRLVDFPPINTPHGPLDPFFNINTPADFQEAHRFEEILS